MATQPSQTAYVNPVKTYAGVGYDVTYFARKHRISKQQARDLMRKVGHDRDKLNEAVATLKA